MPVKTNHGGNLRTQFVQKQLIATERKGLSEKRKKNIKKWTTRYRRNWDLYVEEVYQIKLYPLQKFIIHMMGVSDLFFAICTRGAAKSFLVALGALCAMDLLPYSEIVITSSTVPQAAKLVEKKIRDELIKKLSPYLLYKYQHEYIVITKSSSSDGAYTVENKLNHSTITVLACLDSSRGSRSTINIYEEARLLKKSLIDSVFEPMGHARQAKFYINYPEYHTPRWEEKARSIYITSARFKAEWFWNTFKKAVSGYYTSKSEFCVPFAEDIYAAIDDGARTWADYRKNKRSMSTLDFRMEIENEMIGESESAFFTYNSFKDNQVLERCFRPPTIMQLYMGEDIGNPLKKENEIRLIISDFAFANTTSSEKNDNTQIMLMSLHWKKTRFERHIDYITQHPASDSLGAADRIRELYYDYQADYYVPDLRNGGEVIYNYITQPKDRPERGIHWNKHGFGICDRAEYQVVAESKLKDLRERTVDPDPIKCIIPITATGELNSIMWVNLKRQLEANNIKFLISMQDYQTLIEDDGTYYNMTPEQLADALAPFGEMDMLVNEAINLNAEYRNDKVILSEPRSGTKDRAVCLNYGNYIATLIETEWLKQNQEDEFDFDEYQLVF